MAWRFKASKYKNAAPIVPKAEACVREICVGSYQTYGNNIAASAAFMAFNWEHTGSSVAVLPLDDCGRKSKTMPLLHGHTDTVTDLKFSPFHDGLLATASQDCLVKIWHIPEKGLEQSLSDPEAVFSHKQRRVETVGFHPTADGMMYSTAAGCVALFDLRSQKEIFSNNEHPEVIQSASWREDGTVLATSCKDKCVRIFDPRASGSPLQMVAESHQSIKDSRVVWLGGQPRILTTGFDAARLRQVIIRDIRNFGTPEKTLELDCSTGILMPLFDPDTNMLFLAGKGDTTINYLEITDKDPYLIEGLRHTGEQTKGACLVPKRALRVMEAEVNRVLQLTSNMVIPIMYQVPRKTYRDFHADLYPETTGYKTELIASEWLNGSNQAVPKMNLDPAKRELGDEPIIIHRGNLSDFVKNLENQRANGQGKGKATGQKSQTQIQTQTQTQPPNQSAKRNDNDHFVMLSKGNNFEEKNGNDNSNQNGAGQKKSCSQAQSQPDGECSELIRKFEAKYKIDTEKDVRAAGGDGHDDEKESPTEHSAGSSEDASASSSGALDTHSASGSNSPPKPMPRTSRNNSLPEASDSAGESSSTTTTPRPRPRTTAATAYKPRLGPKPFSSTTGDVSFDKVFAVPLAPGSHENISNVGQESGGSGEPAAAPTHVQPSAKPDLIVEIEIKKKNERETVASAGNGVQKSLTTSERRKSSADDDESSDKIFEQNSESSENSTEGEDRTDADLRRFSSARSSIAERRRLYENRSKSQVDEKAQSPVPLRREHSKVEPLKPNQQQQQQSTCIDSKRISVPEGKLLEEHRQQRGNNGAANAAGLKKSATEAAFSAASTKRTSTVFGKVSKFRHLKGTPGHKSTHIENLRNLSRQIPGECNGFHANHERVAVPLSGPGGKIAIFELSRPGRLPDGVIPSLVNGSNIMDFQWDPFDAQRLAVACDDGIVKLWHIAEGGLSEPTNTPAGELTAHLDKIYFIRFHPLAADVLLTASYDMTIKLWDLRTMTEKCALTGHSDQIFDFAWSPCGRLGATVCKDGKIRVYNPRKSEMPIREGNGPVGTRGARITWAVEGQYIVCTGFDKVSERQISVYNAQKLTAPLNTASLDVSPSILIPFYDEDSSTLFVTGKGDSTIYCYEITDEEPYICPLSHHRCTSLHQGLSFLTKNHCDVASVEFSKAYRLTNTTIEPLSFTVPRIKSELFQDDLFPPTRITWSATLSADDWFASNNDKAAPKISLKPEGMETLSSIQQVPVQHTKKSLEQHAQLGQKSEYEINKQQEIQKSVSARMEYTTKLEQDDMEGVDENEWQE
ncbi:coronin-7 isoform X1 [Drosophila pseudoobscura]|uniref:Coronin n=1 Tax=Drosophila pseudoobscura pseudoobscura TaxID=46245 RepID=A0A6I8W3V0_DROPS|nr:coronin-7 isoform X1 [Drosophila pseudoobscura]XP_015041272.2 coronin-7 isoform X1 [Drosophila pseudoobscura]XP_015041273.2 coronin-7 isoform X1 [Drosophila pseudoobscura]XP_033238019.1 coronin-7 isoform X1 [Drosophila pseudoobscura]XP_033238020.1 coronin-7 isoform X1 [Drosophila pseudoobscura]XP_033238021.1 coronin-7 isoform X1 [Drosophila pseudoobscura]XP_033238022.1 coronin-7 isoform X1 [Drosophila pseudoobscura]